MFVVLYDKDFKALGRWTTYPCSSWTLTKKAVEFDELTCVTRTIDNSKNAVFVGLHENDGSLVYMALCGKPTTAKGQTTIKAVDLRQIFSQKINVELSRFTQSYNQTPAELFSYLLGLPKSISLLGFTYDVDVTELNKNHVAWKTNSIETEDGICNVWSLLQASCSWYDCYIETNVDLIELKITFKVKVITELISFKMSDFSQTSIVNNSTVTNRVIVTDGTNKSEFILLSDDSIIDFATAKTDYQNQIIYPARVETIKTDKYSDAVKQGLQILYKNRFQSKVTIDSNCALGSILLKLDLNTFADIYGYNAADNSTSKRLPVMSITQSSGGTTKVSFGRLSEYWY